MAITFTQLAAGTADTSQGTSYAGTAGTPAAGDLLIAFVTATGTVAAGSMTGGGWTWAKRFSITKNAGADTLYIFTATATAATSTTPTFDCTGDQATGACIYVLRVTGDSAYLRPYFRQINSNTGSTANPSVTMNRAILTGSGVCGMCANGTNSSTQFTAPTNWTENSEVTYATPSTAQEVASRASGETGSTITWTNANTSAWGAIVLEIAVDGSVDFSENEEEVKPSRKRRALPILDELSNLLTSTLGGTTAYARQHQLYPKLKKKKPQQEEVIPNLLTSTLSGTTSVVVPRARTIPPQLKKRVTKQQTETPNLLTSTLSGVTPTEVIVPRQRSIPPRLKKRTSKQEAESPNLLTSTLATGGTTVNVPRQRTIPLQLKKRTSKQSEEVPNLLTSTLASAGYQTRIAMISPLLKKRKGMAQEGPQNLLTSTLTPAQQVMARVHPVIKKLKKRRSAKQEEETPNLLTSTLGAAEYIGRLAIVQQKLKKRGGLSFVEIGNLLTTTLGTTPIPPFFQQDQGDRLRKRTTVQKVTDEINLLTSTLAPIYRQRIPITLAKLKRRLTKQEEEAQNSLLNLLNIQVNLPPGLSELYTQLQHRKAVQLQQDVANFRVLTTPPGVPYFSSSYEIERTARRQRGRYVTPGESFGVPVPLLPIPPPPVDPMTWVGVSLTDVWRRGGE